MTDIDETQLRQAIAVLNRVKHKGCTDWMLSTDFDACMQPPPFVFNPICVMCEADVEGVCEHCGIRLCGSCVVDHRIVRPCVPRVARSRPANERLAALIEELEECEQLRRELRRRAMIFQCAAKEQVAITNGLPADAYYELSYEEWGEVWREYQKKQAA